MTVAIRYGDVSIVPTQAEWALGGGSAVGVVYGLYSGNNTLAAFGAIGLAACVWRSYERALEVRQPDLMNAYFQTGGALSASQGDPFETAALDSEAPQRTLAWRQVNERRGRNKRYDDNDDNDGDGG